MRAAIPVPIVADFCIVHVVTDDNEIRQVEVAHVNPAKLELAVEQLGTLRNAVVAGPPFHPLR